MTMKISRTALLVLSALGMTAAAPLLAQTSGAGGDTTGSQGSSAASQSSTSSATQSGTTSPETTKPLESQISADPQKSKSTPSAQTQQRADPPTAPTPRADTAGAGARGPRGDDESRARAGLPEYQGPVQVPPAVQAEGQYRQGPGMPAWQQGRDGSEYQDRMARYRDDPYSGQARFDDRWAPQDRMYRDRGDPRYDYRDDWRPSPRWRDDRTWRDDYDPRHNDRRYRDRWSTYDDSWRSDRYGGSDDWRSRDRYSRPYPPQRWGGQAYRDRQYPRGRDEFYADRDDWRYEGWRGDAWSDRGPGMW
jgi:hypothetical protein